jgi:DNA-binding NtrC family response regulator
MTDPHVIQLLLIEDEAYDVRRVESTIGPFRARIALRDVVASGTGALDLLRAHPDRYDVVIMDFQIAGGLMGEQLIREIKKLDPSLQIIVITKMTINITDFAFANRLLQAGAFWYCTKYPGDIEAYIYQPTDFILGIFNAYEKGQLEKERLRSNTTLTRSVEKILAEKSILGDSEGMKGVREQIQKCADTNATVLISGPSGTGKEFVAHNIHYRGARKFERFVPVNCGGLPSELVESELFGYEKGSFTGAATRKLGLFEVANHGTLFLDEVAELPLPAQVKLLRVIQDGEIEKIGRTDKIKVDVRIIAATNKQLEEEVEAKRFREDLFYRLNVVHVQVPPLRERRTDIPLYVDHFLQLFCEELNRGKPDIEPEALQMLRKYDWPGNVRELKNALMRVLYDAGDVITVHHVEAALGRRIRADAGAGQLPFPFADGQEVVPWRQMERTLREKYFAFVRRHSSSDAEAAKKLGLAPPNYHRMCKELGIK